jgi:16S rRNA (uracil1498-N3)-methyltransferase
VPKSDRGELAVELATEAGVDALVPWAASRCVARWTADRAGHGVERWRAAAREAAKQSRRPFVPQVAELSATPAVAELIKTATAALVLHEGASAPLQAAELPQRGDVVLIVGPEGGLTEEELTVFRAAGAVPVRLGPQVLRTSTAGAVALGALGVLTGRWS